MNWELITIAAVGFGAAWLIIWAALEAVAMERRRRSAWDALRDFAADGNQSAQDWLTWARANLREPKDRR